MVAVALGLVVTLAVLIMQAKLTRQNVRASDTSLRDNEARAAMDVIARELTGGGFLHAGTTGACAAVLQFNSSAPAPNYFVSYPVAAMAASANTRLPFVASPGITLNYPATSSVNRSDVLIVRSTSDATQFGSATTPLISVTENSAYAPLITGVLPFSSSPVPLLTNGDVGVLQTKVGTAPLQSIACLRVPVTTLGTLAGSTSMSSSGALMPTNFYSGFSAQLGLLGLGGNILSDPQLQMSSQFINLGAAAATNQRIFAYFVDADPAKYQWPTLVRATINPLTDLEVANSRQELAAGIVSFQVLFGIGTPSAGVSQYQTWAAAVAAGNTPNIMTVKIMVLSRSIYPDNGFSNALTNGVVNIRSQFGQTGYTNYTIPSGEISNHFVAQEAELVVRSSLWLK